MDHCGGAALGAASASRGAALGSASAAPADPVLVASGAGAMSTTVPWAAVPACAMSACSSSSLRHHHDENLRLKFAGSQKPRRRWRWGLPSEKQRSEWSLPGWYTQHIGAPHNYMWSLEGGGVAQWRVEAVCCQWLTRGKLAGR